MRLFVLGILLVPVMVILYNAGTLRLGALLFIIAVGTAGLSAPGTLYAAMTAQLRAKQTLQFGLPSTERDRVAWFKDPDGKVLSIPNTRKDLAELTFAG